MSPKSRYLPIEMSMQGIFYPFYVDYNGSGKGLDMYYALGQSGAVRHFAELEPVGSMHIPTLNNKTTIVHPYVLTYRHCYNDSSVFIIDGFSKATGVQPLELVTARLKASIVS